MENHMDKAIKTSYRWSDKVKLCNFDTDSRFIIQSFAEESIVAVEISKHTLSILLVFSLA